jgi:hypothetical protein
MATVFQEEEQWRAAGPCKTPSFLTPDTTRRHHMGSVYQRQDGRWVANYVHELIALRAMVRQEDGQGDTGWGGTWTKERYQSVKDKHPEALMAFEAELRSEKEEEQHRREILEQYKHSVYIEEVEGWPDSEAKDSYLRDLKRLRDAMIHSKKLGYGASLWA